MNGETQFLSPVDSWLLDGLAEGEIRRASGLLEGCEAQFFPAGTRALSGELPPAASLIVEKGFIVVHAMSSGRPIVVAEAGAGAILLPPSSQEQLHALTDCSVTVIPPDLLEGLLAMPGVARRLFQALGSTLRLRQDATRHLSSVRHVDRVRQKLLQLAAQFGRVGPDGIRIEFPLTHDLLAEMVGSARETATRAVDDLQRSGFMVRDGHSYRLTISPEALDHPA